jgi:toxin ParE1/3/4
MTGRNRPVIWSPEARADLFEIWNYYARVAGRQTADNVVRDIGEVCRLIEDHRFGGRARDALHPGLRSIASRPNVVFYRVHGDAVEIVRILDGRRDVDEIFADDLLA